MATDAMIPMNKSQALIDSYLAGMEADGELLPGVRPQLFGMITRQHRGGPDHALAALVGLLEGDRGERYLDPGREARAEHPLMRHLRRLERGGHLVKGGADKMYTEWVKDFLNTERPELVAGALARRLDSPESKRYLKNPTVDYRAPLAEERGPSGDGRYLPL